MVTAGVRRPSATVRLAERLVAATRAAAADLEVEVATVVVDIRSHAEDLARAVIARGAVAGAVAGRAVAGVAAGGAAEAGKPVLAARDAVCAADGLIAVTPTFAGSYTGLFKMFFDLFEPASLAGMPALIGATGGSARHTLVLDHALRPLLAHFHADVLPTGVFAEPAEIAEGGPLAARIARAAGELAARLAVPGANL